MPAKTMTQQVFEINLLPGSRWKPGEILRIDPSRMKVLLQDATGVTVWEHMWALDPDATSLVPSLVVQYIDHNTLGIDNRNADDHRFIKSNCARRGAYCSDMGNGICHQVNTERFAKPWDFWIGSDSHTSTSGAHGCIAIGAGGLEVASVLHGESFEIRTPKVYGIYLTGKLSEWVEAKDVILELLRRIGVKGGLGYVLEFYGPGVKTFSLEERATICNMGAETGATTSIFPADERTKQFLKLQEREEDYKSLYPDRGVKYDKDMSINLSEIVPLVAYNHSPGEVAPVRELAGKKVAQVALGSSVNSWFPDMAKVDLLWQVDLGKLDRDNIIHSDVTTPVTPGSSQILNTLIRLGIWKRFVEAGAVPITPMCGACVGIGQAPPSGSVSVRAFNRNFEGRSGTVNDNVYLVSPSTAAATAVEGFLIDPRDFAKKYGIEYQRIRSPKPVINDSLIIPPPPESERDKVQIIWGPNIIPPEKNEPLPENFAGRIATVLGDNVNTGDLSPDGADTMGKRSDIPAISMDTLKNKDPEFAKYSLELKRRKISSAIAGGRNYGQGSSREHAAIGPRHLGVVVVFAKDFARIHRRNLIQHGIIPVLISDEVYEEMEKDKQWFMPDIRKAVESGTREFSLAFPGTTKDGKDFVVHHDLGDGREDEPDMILAGGFINLILEKKAAN